MCEITLQIACPHCHSTKVVKNGKKKTGVQNYLCKDCKKQFIQSYKNKGAEPRVKHLIVSMLLRNSGIRDIETILQVSRKTVQNTLIKEAEKCKISPKKNHYKSVQIDEFWSYCKKKKGGKRWIIYAYAPETDEVIGYVIGKRDKKTMQKLLLLLKDVIMDVVYTDNWETFISELKGYNHVVGKQFTKAIEGVNTSLRARNRRLVRKTTCFSKKDENHNAAIALMFQQRNYAHHTF